MNSPPSFEGDPPGDDEDLPYEWIDEWLCEYVDGTMEPALEAVFEQYVEANPELKAHVERLQETRNLLCECGPSKAPPPDLEAKICTEVECDMLQSDASVSEVISNRPLAAFGLASSVVAALVIGFLVGAMLVEPSPSRLSNSTSTVDRGASGAHTTSPRPIQTTTVSPEVPPLLLRRSSSPFSTPDSTRPSSSLTTIGFP